MTHNIKIPHPDFGYVEFTAITARQLDVLEDYLKCKKYIKKEKVGKEIRKGAKV